VVELAVRALAPVVVAPQVAELAQVLAVVLQAARPVAALLLAVAQQLAELVLQQAELAQRPAAQRQPVVQRQLVLVRQLRLVQQQLQLQQPRRLVWWLPVWRLRRLWLRLWPRKLTLSTLQRPPCLGRGPSPPPLASLTAESFSNWTQRPREGRFFVPQEISHV
jgi:hypothetical protein